MAVGHWQRRLQRLKVLSWDELATRLRQGLAKRWDAVVFSRLDGRKARPAPGPSGRQGRFFFQPQDVGSIAAFIRQRLPETAAAVVAEADRICRHRFNLLGYSDLDYGPDINWHLDAVSGKVAPRRPWYKIRYLEYSEVGDVKVTWELNRHQHLVTMAKAYRFTGEPRYLEELVRQWYGWRQQNPYPIGVNWASSLEVAFRSLSWMWVRSLVGDSPLLPPEFHSDLERGLRLHGRHIERYLSIYFSPNTHLLGEAVALFFLGVLCRLSNHAERWKRKGWELTLVQAERQVQPDGMHFEQSSYYHVYALDFFLHARTLAARNGLAAPPAFDAAIERMLNALSLLSRGGGVPAFGDDDGGRLFDPRRNRSVHLTDPLTTGAVVFRRPDFKALAPALIEETIWLLGREGAQQFDNIQPAATAAHSLALPSSGYHLMISAGKGRCRLFLDAAAMADALCAGHSHADALSLQLAVNGKELLSDRGTFAYVAGARDAFRGTAAHNTLQVDGVDQAQPAGLFHWQSLPEIRAEKSIAGRLFDLVIASHTGYCRLPDPVLHRRCVFYGKPDFWLVLDLAHGHALHQLELNWHLAPGCDCQLQGNVAVVGGDSARVALIIAEGHDWSPAVRQTWHSPVYGSKSKAPTLQFSAKKALPTAFATLLLPFAPSDEEPGTLTPLHEESPQCALRVYRYRRRGDLHLFVFAAGGQRWQWRSLASDAELLYYGRNSSGAERLFLSSGSYLEFDQRQLLSCARPLARYEWISERGGMQVFSSGETETAGLPPDSLSGLQC